MTSHEFIRSIAAMHKDGEEVDGREFVLENDEAVDALGDLIDQARDLLKTDAGFKPWWDAELATWHGPYYPDTLELARRAYEHTHRGLDG